MKDDIELVENTRNGKLACSKTLFRSCIGKRKTDILFTDDFEHVMQREVTFLILGYIKLCNAQSTLFTCKDLF